MKPTCLKTQDPPYFLVLVIKTTITLLFHPIKRPIPGPFMRLDECFPEKLSLLSIDSTAQ